ncbi:MAG: hypothetical protein LBJ35_07290 [Spirochaetaceae bacterium]|jgi:hypothetical protein|nr:hypothetical protein [Spirochaetaceae bacterium]
MVKKVFKILVFALLVTGKIFGQTENEASNSRFAFGGGITGGMALGGFQVEAEIDIGKNGANVLAIEAGTTDLFLFQAFLSFRNYVFEQDIAYISYGATFGISSMLFGATFGGGIRMPLTKDKKWCLDTNGKLAVGLMGFPKAFASTAILYRF